MRSIWKFELVEGNNLLEVPRGAGLLDIQTQGRKICSWWIVDTGTTQKELVTLTTCGTGWELDSRHTLTNYVKTVQDGPYVWHVFLVSRGPLVK